MKIYVLLLSATLLGAGCSSPSGQPNSGIPDDSAKNQLLQADLAFSQLSASHGQQYAYMQYMADQGVLLRPHHDPMKESMVRLFIQMMDTSKSSMTWRPTDAEVSSSGDLGYTYGVYSYRTRDSLFQGTYVTVWKKDPDGKWKAVLDSGNPGLAPTKAAP